jgi:hypothetical protein
MGGRLSGLGRGLSNECRVKIMTAIGLFRHTGGMVGLGSSGDGRRVSGAREWLCVAGLAVCWSGAVLGAQDRASAGVPNDAQGVRTLHVYENLLQVPVLVLRPDRDRIQKPIDADRFSVSLDAGPWFRATHVRREGDDPISLSILLDVTGDGGLLMPKMAEAIAKLAPESLQPPDRVSVYALDCTLISGAKDVPADSAGLKRAVDESLLSWTARKGRKHTKGGAESDCKEPEYLWDALAELTDGLHKLPGRRVILVMSAGEDMGSELTWNQVRAKAQVAGVAIFGLKYIPNPTVVTSTATNNQFGARGQYSVTTETATKETELPVTLGAENPFLNLCELSGGTVSLVSPKVLEKKLKGFTAMVRERYVVEFPRPTNGKAGMHGLQVRIDKGDYFISAAGVTFPLMAPAVLADPTTVRSDPSRAPIQGLRHSLPVPQ